MWISAASAVVAGVLSFCGAAQLIDRPVADAALRSTSAWPPAAPARIPDVTIVAIDPRSLRAFPEWPWSRARYAEAAQRLFAAGARVVAFDVDLSTPRDAEGDAAFAAAIHENPRVVLAALRQRQDVAGVGELEVVSWPAPAFLGAGARPGHVVVPLDADGVVRSANASSELGGERVASLPAAVLELLGTPIDSAQSRHRIDFRRAQPSVPTLSFADVIEDRIDPAEVSGRVVFVGATAAEFQDLWTTPVGAARPGVWVQAIEYRTLAARAEGGAGLRAAPHAALAAVCFLVALAAQWASTGSPRRRGLGFGLLALGIGASCWALLQRFGVLLTPTLPLATLVAHHALGLESVRRRLGALLVRRELSLSALHQAGAQAAGARDEQGIEAGLVLLGRIVDAHAVALLRASPSGVLDGTRVDWRPRGEIAAVDPALAADVLAHGSLRACAEIPGRPGVRGRAIYVPLVAGRTPVGVLVVESRSTAPLGEVELRTVATVAAQLALTARSLRLAEELRATLGASVEAIASAVEARDGYTELHCRRLALFCVSMARRLDLPPEEVEAIRLGALLHDVGKIGVRDHILLKAGRFSPAERAEMERHAEIGHRIVRPISGLGDVTMRCVRNHHERWDGTGYPDRLAGDAIPLGARIVAIVDVWDALSSARPYKPAYSQAEVLRILEKDRGTHFDPKLVDLFLQVLEEEGEEMLALIAQSSEAAA
ncbi:MAG TPA: CHASE2 domain-containing protein [Myxococcota bacterium]|nr:CHASE2 domain-containing protein [Myxococcota bacterium]